MKKMRNILRFLSLMVCLHAFIFCAQTPTDPSAEIQITEFPIAPEPTRKPQSRLSIIPQKVEKKSPKLVSADDVIIEPEGSILAPPALNQSEIKKGESIIKPQVKENEESLRADPVTTDHEKPAEISPVAEPEAAPVKETKPTVVARGKGWKSRKKTDQPLAVKVPEGQLTTQSAPPLPATEPVTIDPAKPAAISPVAEPASPLVKEKELLPTTELAKSSAASPVVEPVALPVAPTNKSRWRNRSKRNAEQIAADAAGQKNGDSASQPTANQPVSEVLELQEQSVTAQPVAQEIAEQAPGFPVSPAQDGMVQPTANQTAVEISPEVVGQPEQLVTAQAAPTQALTMQEATDRVPAESVAEQPIANKAELALPETPSGKQAPQKLGQQSIRHVGEKQVSAMQPSAGAAQEGIAQPMAEKPDGKQPKKPVAKSSQTLPNGRKRKRVDQAKMAPSLESPAQIPAPELTLPEAPKTDNLPSMADAPVGPARKEFIKEGIEGTLAEKEEKKESREAFEKLAKKGTIHLGQYLEPWKGTDPNETVEMNFDNKELTELLKFLSNNLDVTFILDDSIEPARVDGLQPLAGTKISFKSNTPLTLKQAWEIGLTFLEMAGFSVIPATQPRMYRVTASASRDKASANREPLPTFIGTDPELLPDNDSKIRYVYFADNAELPTIIQIIDAMKSASSGPLIEVPQLKAVIMTDKAANIKSLVRILQEIDKVTLPETLAIIRLRHTDARQVRELYQRLIGKDPSNPIFNPFARQRKPSTTQYFTEATRVFEEPRTNSLIVLGTRENIKRFEDFIIQYIDKTIDLPFSPLHIIQLKYIDATSIAKILNDVIQKFNSDPSNTSAALVGGVRDSNKFFRPSVRVTEEPAGNRLIINADYEEYLKLREIIEKLDVEQPQVAIKVLILNVDLSNTETLGTQLRNKADCCDRTGGLDSILGTNVNFQTSMVGPIVPNEPAPGALPINGANRLLGNLLNLANQVNGVSPFGIGTTLVTLGQDMFGFWGLLRALETYTRVSVVANPFLVTTHKYKAEIRVGETRRTTTATVEGQREAQAQGDIAADLRVVITPQISYDDMVTLNVYVELTQFTSTDPNNANRIVRKVSTEALLANKEVLALGGLIQDTKNETTYKVPFLGDIPLLGWLFKNKSYYIERTSLLILIAPEIIKPFEPEVAEAFTFSKLGDAKDTLFKMRNPAELRDPIHRWMFNDHKNKEISAIDKFVAMQQRYIDESQRKSEVIALNDKPKTSDKKGGVHA